MASRLRRHPDRAGFTLVEMLVVVAILATLVGMLAPPLLSARAITRKAVCQANIRNLQLANQLYQKAFDGFYAPGAPGMFASAGTTDYSRVNCARWFGVRGHPSEPFTREDGPLSPYLSSHQVKGCPSFTDYKQGFESGCGGYGYNNNFVGQFVMRVRAGVYRPAHDKWHLSGNMVEAFPHPTETVAFTDTAFAGFDGDIEYSFCESPKWPLYPNRRVVPSIHFRHLGKANIVWLDGHVGSEPMSFSDEDLGPASMAGRSKARNIGWFGPKDNKLFDCN